MDLFIRRLEQRDAAIISDAFAQIGWNKPANQYQHYFVQQQNEKIIVLVAEYNSTFAGYGVIHWSPDYSSFPEIQDLNVLPHYRRRGIATALMDEAEMLIAKRSDRVGIGVGLHPGYNAAQRMYVLRGYVPDGRGVTWKGVYIEEGQPLVADDHLVLHMIKWLNIN